MQSSPLVAVALVGLALVCVGLVVVGGLLLARRVIGRSVDTAVSEGSVRRRSSPKPDLRAIAQAQDFDAALARQGETPAAQMITRPPETPFPDAPPALGRRSKSRTTHQIDDDDEDALADFADDL